MLSNQATFFARPRRYTSGRSGRPGYKKGVPKAQDAFAKP
jgi:hypothetical protein